GYLKDYELLKLDPERWDCEPVHTAESMLKMWRGGDISPTDGQSGASVMQPSPLTKPHPPLFLATSSPDGVAYAAKNGFPLQHYFAMPVEMRVKIEQSYQACQPSENEINHMHSLIVIVGRNEAQLRERLEASLIESFKGGDWPKVPQAAERHIEGRPVDIDLTAKARYAAANAIVGPIESVQAQLDAFIEKTGAKRLVLYMEAIADAATTRSSIEHFAEHILH
ncbi:MAG: LLM class flavin-dependent oxidoreductase, partial [Pseudomonadota bacterium]